MGFDLWYFTFHRSRYLLTRRESPVIKVGTQLLHHENAPMCRTRDATNSWYLGFIQQHILIKLSHGHVFGSNLAENALHKREILQFGPGQCVPPCSSLPRPHLHRTR